MDILRQTEITPPMKEFLVVPSLLKFSWMGCPNMSCDFIKEYFFGVNLWICLISYPTMLKFSFVKSPIPSTRSTVAPPTPFARSTVAPPTTSAP